MFQRIKGFGLYLGIALGMALVSLPARATNITLQGQIEADDAIQLFNLTVTTPGLVDIRSYGYGGGITSTGTAVPSGGFDTILTLFDGAGTFLSDNDDGAGAAVDPSTGFASDARITMTLAPGAYVVALTQYDNFSIGNLPDGFGETGNPNFTANPGFTAGGPCPNNLFRDISDTAGRCRDGNWTVDLVNVASVTQGAAVPEPGTVALFAAGLLGLALASRGKRSAAIALPVLMAVFGSAASAQGPDYSNVGDFLGGKRTLLAIDDLVVSGIIPDPYGGDGQLISPVLTTTNSQLNPPTSPNPTRIDPEGAKILSTHIVSATSATPLQLIAGINFGIPVINLPSLNNKMILPPILDSDHPLSVAGGVVADFDHDGLDELVLNYTNGTTIVGTKLQLNSDEYEHLTYGPPSTLDALTDMTVGDFNGDGQLDIAGLVTLPSGGIDLVIYTVDPKTLAVSRAAQITLQKQGTAVMVMQSITAGRFTPAGHDQLVVAAGPALTGTTLEIIDFPPSSLTPQEETSYGILIGYGSNPTVKVRTGRFFIPEDFNQQVVFSAWNPGGPGGPIAIVFRIDPTTLAWRNYTGYQPRVAWDDSCEYDIAVGNFDNRQPDPSNPGQTQHNLNDQIAVLMGVCGAGARRIDIVQVGSKPPTNSIVSTTVLPGLFNNLGDISLTQSDTQGRSLILGSPTKITVSKAVQPSVVIGAPPMHVDYISPDQLDGKPPQVLNLSAVPDGFNTTYEVDNSAEQQSGTTNTTSWSYGTKTSAGGYIQFGDPDVTGIKVSDMSTAAEEMKSTAGQQQGSYTRNTYNIFQATGFGDQVTYLNSDFNVWVYPVIGQNVCPAAASPNCQKVPLTIQFSAPNGNASTAEVQAQLLQWYQPPWEPGNIFSYPANSDQLHTIYPNLAKLTTDGAEFFTDTSTETQKTSWAVGTKTSQSTSVEQNFSYENDFSSAFSASFLDVGGGASVDYDISGSNGLSNLTESASDLGTATGIGTRKPGTFANPDLYAYSVSPYIVGTTKPGGLVDDQPLNTDVKTFGSIRGLFTADPLSSSAGGWWQQAYSLAPDVALNHPSRWKITFEGLAGTLPSNCLTTGTGASQMDCAELTQSTPKNPWLSTFHQMRGFFITNANSPGQGMQLQQAKAGDVLALQARVYNYSLAPMPADSKVHVRFYFQPWRGTVPNGASVLIGESQLDPIPAFNDVTGAPSNWVLASTTFDTGKYEQTMAGDADIIFWVVVWIQGADGSLVQEMPWHGLTAIPGTLTALADAAQLEQVASDNNSYDNNVGFYKQVFHIAQNNSLVGAPPSAPSGLLDIGKVDVSARRLTPHDTIAVSATLSTSGGPTPGITATFYDGDPKQSGRPFGVERVPYIATDTSYDVATTYQTSSCGTHELFVVLDEGKTTEIVRRAPPVRVDCSGVISRSGQTKWARPVN